MGISARTRRWEEATVMEKTSQVVSRGNYKPAERLPGTPTDIDFGNCCRH